MSLSEGCIYVYAPVLRIYVCLTALFLSCPWCSAGHVVLTGADQLLSTSTFFQVSVFSLRLPLINAVERR